VEAFLPHPRRGHDKGRQAPTGGWRHRPPVMGWKDRPILLPAADNLQQGLAQGSGSWFLGLGKHHRGTVPAGVGPQTGCGAGAGGPHGWGHSVGVFCLEYSTTSGSRARDLDVCRTIWPNELAESEVDARIGGILDKARWSISDLTRPHWAKATRRPR
jgi:hypothetical protein